MAIIGLNDETGLSSAALLDTDAQLIFNDSSFQFTAGASDEVFRFGAYLNGASSQIEVGLYDVSSGVDGATLVGATQTLTGLSGANWITADFAAIALTNGNTYSVGWRSIAASSTMYRSYSADAVDQHASLTGADALSTWAAGGTFSQRYAVYAETQTAGASNSAPVVNDQTFSVADSASNGTVIGTLIATDSDGTVDSYAISGTTLAINSTTGQITLADNSGIVAGTPITATATVTDNDGDTDTATVTVNVTNSGLSFSCYDADSSNAAITSETLSHVRVLDPADLSEVATATSIATSSTGSAEIDTDSVTIGTDYLVIARRSNGDVCEPFSVTASDLAAS